MNIFVISLLILWVLFTVLMQGNCVILSTVEVCQDSSECPSTRKCIQGFCKSPCMEICGPEALCIVRNHEPYCFCKNGEDKCIRRKVTRPCVPECKENSICGDSGFCECAPGYHGHPYRGCLKKCTTYKDCPTYETCDNGSCKSPCDSDCGINSLCVPVDHISICSCPPGYTGNAFEICRPIADALRLTKTDICNQCAENAKCKTVNGTTNCVCPRGYVGNPFIGCNKMCLFETDCPADKNCVNHACTDPCEDACGVNTDCSVDKYKRKPNCTCKVGFSGDPSRICMVRLESRFADTDDELKCHPICGANATCNTKYGICTCNTGFTGNPYGGCRKKCKTKFDCPGDKTCLDEDCKDPCLTACGKHAVCTVHEHSAICECPYGFTGNAFEICREIVITTPTIIDVDLCDSFTCGENAKCKMNGTEMCSCLPGYSGNPYKTCSKNCKTNFDCPDEKTCINRTCENACQSFSCGINSLCKAEKHAAVCFCPEKYKGDPSKICFPDTKGVLLNPSKIPCLKCICRAITGNDNIFACAEKSISFGYWAFAGEVLVGGEDFRTRNSTIDFITCMNNKICILNTMNDYISRALHRLNDVDCDGEITCADYFAAHKFGLTAKFSDSLFNASEASSFDQCEDHGEKDVSHNWVPKKCIGPSYIEILS